MRELGKKNEEGPLSPVDVAVAVNAADEQAVKRGSQQDEHQAVREAPMKNKFVEVVHEGTNEHINIGSSCSYGAPKQGFFAGLLAQYRFTDSGTKQDMCEGIQEVRD